MRLLLYGINYAPDLIGVAKYNTEMADSLAALGHDVRVVTAVPYYPAWKVPDAYRGLKYTTDRLGQVEVTRAPLYVPSTPSGTRRLLHHASFAFSSSIPLIKALRQWQPQVMITVAPSLMSAPFAAWCAQRAGAVSWLHIQDFEVDAAFELGLLKNPTLRAAMFSVERSILKRFDRVSTISPQMVRRLQAKGVRPERVYELRNWIDIDQIIPGDRMTQLREELGYGETDVIALYSGNMASKQGLELLIEAARQVKVSSLKIIMCGDGPQKRELQTLAAGLGNMRFMPLQPMERFAQLLTTADIHLIPQRAEAADLVLPSKLGGILASGRPALAMAAAGTGLADEIGDAGITVPPGDAGAFADALDRLTWEGDLRIQMGVSARHRAEQRWDRTAIIRRFESELSIAVNNRAG